MSKCSESLRQKTTAPKSRHASCTLPGRHRLASQTLTSSKTHSNLGELSARYAVGFPIRIEGRNNSDAVTLE
jgi:hypothetical protein